MSKIIFVDRVSLVRALAAGRFVWCVETGEAWQLGDNRSLNRARRIAAVILSEVEHKTFYSTASA